MCSSRLLRSTNGRPVVCIVSGAGAPDVPRGHLYVILGDNLPVYSAHPARWLGTRSGRAPTGEEMSIRAPYHPPNYGPAPEREPSDEELDEAAAIEAARLEQQRQPVDLTGRYVPA